MEERLNYGGQAIIEGVMMRGRRRVVMAARAPDGEIHLRSESLNAALYAELRDGTAQAHHVHRKVFLPTYGVFQEERFVEAGETFETIETRWGRAAILICEDLWHPSATRAAASRGAELLIVGSDVSTLRTVWTELLQDLKRA